MQWTEILAINSFKEESPFTLYARSSRRRFFWFAGEGESLIRFISDYLRCFEVAKDVLCAGTAKSGRSMPPPAPAPEPADGARFKNHYTCSDRDNNRGRRFLPGKSPICLSDGDTAKRRRPKDLDSEYIWPVYLAERGSRLSGKKFACAGALFIVLRARWWDSAPSLTPRGIQSVVLWRDYLIATTRISLIR